MKHKLIPQELLEGTADIEEAEAHFENLRTLITGEGNCERVLRERYDRLPSEEKVTFIVDSLDVFFAIQGFESQYEDLLSQLYKPIRPDFQLECPAKMESEHREYDEGTRRLLARDSQRHYWRDSKLRYAREYRYASNEEINDREIAVLILVDEAITLGVLTTCLPQDDHENIRIAFRTGHFSPKAVEGALRFDPDPLIAGATEHIKEGYSHLWTPETIDSLLFTNPYSRQVSQESPFYRSACFRTIRWESH